jgi:hypothetical protein
MLDLLQEALTPFGLDWAGPDPNNKFHSSLPLSIFGRAFPNVFSIGIVDHFPYPNEKWHPRLDLECRSRSLKLLDIDSLVEVCNNWNTTSKTPKVWFEREDNMILLTLSAYNWLPASKLYLVPSTLQDDLVSTLTHVVATFIDDVNWFVRMNERELSEMLQEPPLWEVPVSER